MSEQLYRLQRDGEVVGAGGDGFVAYQPCEGRPFPCSYRGQWYCHSYACTARQVEISAVDYGDDVVSGKHRKAFCPFCKEEMQFDHYLVPVDIIAIHADDDDKPRYRGFVSWKAYKAQAAGDAGEH